MPFQRSKRASHRTGQDGYELEAGSVSVLLGQSTDPINVHVITLEPGARLVFLPATGDRVAYVWEGGLRIRDVILARGSSIVVERLAEAVAEGGDLGARIIVFAAMAPVSGCAGGAVHLLPADRVPRFLSENGLAGACMPMGAARPAPPGCMRTNFRQPPAHRSNLSKQGSTATLKTR
ncbi:hypothetical protein [Novosphingobium sp. JCM 18896]|uniref:hypothetical protein n=1 Tax=Novosphingobium sp. JCM 18896 TaxID=2989731 RepID=UPI0022239E11|nr:hypothetical protein [Novosphingobium sp. JCM 18896]MCW1431637.1 hypothetical protein [Novosphingobium sp. JCM 18896]